jgi:hypothetical protein
MRGLSIVRMAAVTSIEEAASAAAAVEGQYPKPDTFATILQMPVQGIPALSLVLQAGHDPSQVGVVLVRHLYSKAQQPDIQQRQRFWGGLREWLSAKKDTKDVVQWCDQHLCQLQQAVLVFLVDGSMSSIADISMKNLLMYVSHQPAVGSQEGGFDAANVSEGIKDLIPPEVRAGRRGVCFCERAGCVCVGGGVEAARGYSQSKCVSMRMLYKVRVRVRESGCRGNMCTCMDVYEVGNCLCKLGREGLAMLTGTVCCTSFHMPCGAGCCVCPAFRRPWQPESPLARIVWGDTHAVSGSSARRGAEGVVTGA